MTLASTRVRRGIGFLVNPIAGMGGRVGLKGTDDVVDQARQLGATPVSEEKARQMLDELRGLLARRDGVIEIRWLTAAGPMGADVLRRAGFVDLQVVHAAADETSDRDTKAAVTACLAAGAELIVFCGGDGTARDVCSITGSSTPILGIPAGVKMYSGVFGISAARSAAILIRYLEGELTLGEADILDIDEAAYRRGEWVVSLCDSALTPFEPSLVQSAKVLVVESTNSAAKGEIADQLREQIESDSDALFLLGPGSTVASIAARFHIHKTLLGVDAIVAGQLTAADLNEQQILALLKQYPRRTLILSPIGAQGFVLGRGNQQLSPAVVREIGRANIVVVATPSKLALTPVLRFDTGDPALDSELAGNGFLPVVTGYHVRRIVKVEL